jgi:hypothetical protein
LVGLYDTDAGREFSLSVFLAVMKLILALDLDDVGDREYFIS